MLNVILYKIISYKTIFFHSQNKQAEKITNTAGNQQLDYDTPQKQRHSFRDFLETFKVKYF